MSVLPTIRRRGSHLALAGTLVAASVALAACGGSTAGTSASGEASSAEAKAAAERIAAESKPATDPTDLGAPVDTSALAGATIFYVPLALKAGHFPFVKENLEQAVETVGASLHTCDGQGNPTGFGSCLDQAVRQRPDAVITDYISYELASTGYEELRDAGIPVLIAGAQPPAGVTTSPTFAFADPKSYGFAAVESEADAVIADSDARAHVLYLVLNASTAIKAQGQHAAEYFKSACPDCEVTVKEVNLSSLSTLPSLVSSALVSDPAIDYVVSQTDTYLAAAISGIQSAGKTRSVKVASAGDVLASVQQVEANPQVIAMAGSNPAYLAWTMADSVFRMLAGKEPPAQYPLMNRLFTKDNIDELDLSTAAEADGSWFGSTDYRTTFATLWGAS